MNTLIAYAIILIAIGSCTFFKKFWTLLKSTCKGILETRTTLHDDD